MNLSKGNITCENVLAISEYVTEGIIPLTKAVYYFSKPLQLFRVEDG
jgi:hypothetical protein